MTKLIKIQKALNKRIAQRNKKSKFTHFIIGPKNPLTDYYGAVLGVKRKRRPNIGRRKKRPKTFILQF